MSQCLIISFFLYRLYSTDSGHDMVNTRDDIRSEIEARNGITIYLLMLFMEILLYEV